MNRKQAKCGGSLRQELTVMCPENQGSITETARFDGETRSANGKERKYIKPKRIKPPRFYTSPLTKRSLKRFQNCKDCQEHPVVYITKSQIPVCAQHWRWLAESNLIWGESD